MEIALSDQLAHDPNAQEAADIVRRCVHCGFCTATCPTYQLLGDELDGPRGRIYLIKQMLEGTPVTRETQVHLDRCLTCRNCETTCPSGVAYGRLIDIGRELVEQQVERPVSERLSRQLLREGLTSNVFSPAVKIGRGLRGILPKVLAEKLPASPAEQLEWPRRQHARKVILPKGCVQPALLPNIDIATALVLDRLSFQSVILEGSGCCGAVRHHLADAKGGLNDARRNIDAWWPLIQSGEAEAILVNASGCAVMVREYGHLLAQDPLYAEKAKIIASLAKDPIELLSPLRDRIQNLIYPEDKDKRVESARSHGSRIRVAYHPPCTQQHGLKIRGAVEQLLSALGAELLPVANSHLCCGSAGTYSVLQPSLSKSLRNQKVNALTAHAPDMVLSANVGCIGHIQSASPVPVMHWLEWVEQITRN